MGLILAVHTFRPLDVVAIVIYLAAMAAMGAYFSKRNKSTEEYFLGNRAFPGWAVGLSMLGTSISSITFLALPAAAFILDWRMLVPNLTLPIIAIIAIQVFIPLFRHGKATSAFEYLERRYGPLARLYAAISFIFLQIIRLGTILYLVAIPISILTGVHIIWVIIIGGVFIAFYTVAGGMEAVIWTDVIQTIILLAGGLISIAYVLYDIPGGLMKIIHVASANHKFYLGDMDFDLSRRTFWIMLILGIYGWLNEYSSNQNVVQRYLAASSEREAKKATLLCALTSVPTWTLFFFIGTCLFAYYKIFPDPAVAGLEADQVFPHFILTRIPAGVAGFIIAAVLAAAMSSLDSSINAVATISVVDLFKRYARKARSDQYYLVLARILSTIAAAFMIGGAIVFYFLPKESMVDLGIIITALFGGCVCGFFLLGFFTTRVDYASVMIALVITILINGYLVLNTFHWLPDALSIKICPYWVNILVNTVFMALAYIISLMRRSRPDSLGKLTIWTMKEDITTK